MYSVQILENKDQNNSKYWHFSRNLSLEFFNWPHKSLSSEDHVTPKVTSFYQKSPPYQFVDHNRSRREVIVLLISHETSCDHAIKESYDFSIFFYHTSPPAKFSSNKSYGGRNISFFIFHFFFIRFSTTITLSITYNLYSNRNILLLMP